MARRFLLRAKVAWLTARCHLMPMWLRCEVVFVHGKPPRVYLNEVEVPEARAQQCVEVAHQTRLRRGLYLEDVASVEFEVMSAATTHAYLSAVDGLED